MKMDESTEVRNMKWMNAKEAHKNEYLPSCKNLSDSVSNKSEQIY